MAVEIQGVSDGKDRRKERSMLLAGNLDSLLAWNKPSRCSMNRRQTQESAQVELASVAVEFHEEVSSDVDGYTFSIPSHGSEWGSAQGVTDQKIW
jgi:hypothetical protein